MTEDPYRRQHQRRLSYMPWLYPRLKPAHRSWAVAWQRALQDKLMALETIHIGADCFIAPEANLFAEPGRDIIIGDGSQIAADVFMHGPIRVGAHVSINHGVSMDGGAAGIRIGDHTRIAARCTIYAFNHGLSSARLVREQPVTSRGINIGTDVWVGAGVGIVDGVSIGDGAVVGMGAVVTRDVAAGTIVAGNPARPVGQRDAGPAVAPVKQ